jgi:flagellar biosynthesis component FlhA
MSKGSDDAGKVVGGAIFVVIFLIAVVPKEVWIVLGVTVGLGLLMGFIAWAIPQYNKSRAAAEERARVERAARAAAAKREREERARGKSNSASRPSVQKMPRSLSLHWLQ